MSLLRGIQRGLIRGLRPGINAGIGPTDVPDAVTGLVATAGASQTIEITWNAAAQAQSYEIYSSTSSPVTTADTLVATVTARSYTHTSVANNVERFYAVLATNVLGEAAALSNEDSATPVITAPVAVTMAPGDDGEVVVTFDPVDGSSSFNFYYGATTGVTQGTGTQVVGVTSPYVLTGQTNGAEVFGIVTALDAGGESGDSVEASATPIAAIVDLAVTPGNGQNSIAWSAPDGADDVDVYRSTSSPVTTADTLVQAGATSPIVDAAVTNGTEYFYAAIGRNTSGSGTQLSNEDSGTPTISAPTNLALAWTTSAIAAAWDPVANATGYDLFRSTSSPVTAGDTLVASDIPSTSYVDSSVTNGTEYFYAARARDATVSPLSNEVSDTALAAPTSLVATAGDTEVVLTWEARLGATGYEVYREATAGVGTGDTLVYSGALTTFTDTGLTNDVEQFYAVRATNATGSTSLSTEDSATPAAVTAPPQTHWAKFTKASSQSAAITDAAQDGALDLATSFTVEMRIKFTSIASSVQYLPSRSSAGQELWKLYYAETAGQLTFETYNSAAGRNAYKVTLGLVAGTEYHIAVVQDLSGSGTKYFYLDGVLQSSPTLVAGAVDTDLKSVTSDFSVGTLSGSFFGDYQIADLRLWNVARSGAQINTNKAVDLDPGSEANLIGLWYKGNSHADLTSHGNDLTPSNGPTFVAYP